MATLDPGRVKAKIHFLTTGSPAHVHCFKPVRTAITIYTQEYTPDWWTSSWCHLKALFYLPPRQEETHIHKHLPKLLKEHFAQVPATVLHLHGSEHTQTLKYWQTGEGIRSSASSLNQKFELMEEEWFAHWWQVLVFHIAQPSKDQPPPASEDRGMVDTRWDELLVMAHFLQDRCPYCSP